MSLDFHLEADTELSIEILEKALKQSGWVDIEKTENHIEAKADCFNFYADKLNKRRQIISEDTRGFSYLVGISCYIRRSRDAISNKPFTRLIEAIAIESSTNFIVSFQYETALYWRDNYGLHKA